MKNATKFSQAHRIFTEEEIQEIKSLIQKLIENHKSEKWWKFHRALNFWINYYINHTLADDTFEEEFGKEIYKEE
jgi:hypothetical protein